MECRHLGGESHVKKGLEMKGLQIKLAMAGMMLSLAFTVGAVASATPECALPRGSRALWDVKALNQAPRTFPVTIPCSNNY